MRVSPFFAAECELVRHVVQEPGDDIPFLGRQLRSSDDPDAKLKEIEQRLRKLASPIRSAEAFVIEEIIDPRETRKILCDFANLVAPLRKPGPTAFRYRP